MAGTGTGSRGRAKAVGGALIVTVAVVFLIILFSSAIKNSMTAFLVPMGESFGRTRGEFAVAPTIFMTTYAVMSPVVGYAADRIGGRNTMLGGLALGGLLFLVAAAVQQFAVFVVLYGVGLAVAYTAVSYVPLGVLVNELFSSRNHGVMYALLTNGTAVGFIVLSPLWIELSSSSSWRTVYVALGVVFLALLVLALFLVPGRSNGTGTVDTRRVVPLSERLRRILGDRGFWAIVLPFAACGASMAFIDVNMIAHLHDNHVTSGMISLSMVILGITEIGGAMASGYLTDRGFRRQVLVGSYAVRALALATLLAYPSAAGSLVFSAMFGVSYMGTVVASTVYLMDAFDNDTRGLALGLMWVIHQAGSALATLGGAMSYDHSRSYGTTIAAIAALVGFATLVSLLFAPATEKRRTTA